MQLTSPTRNSEPLAFSSSAALAPARPHSSERSLGEPSSMPSTRTHFVLSKALPTSTTRSISLTSSTSLSSLSPAKKNRKSAGFLPLTSVARGTRLLHQLRGTLRGIHPLRLLRPVLPHLLRLLHHLRGHHHGPGPVPQRPHGQAP